LFLVQKYLLHWQACYLHIYSACLVQAVCDPADILLLAHFSALKAELDTLMLIIPLSISINVRGRRLVS